MKQIDFDAAFEALTGNEPFPWQRALYGRLVTGQEFPKSCDIPTGLGKTAIIAIWLIALANGLKNVPRRLAYIVNRRTVVDQATDVVVQMRERLLAPGNDAWREHAAVLRSLRDSLKKLAATDGPPLAISTLRGQFADNAEWRADPARPAVIVGTIDMIGSRLLFSGYGCGFKSRPLHAGFLGQDSLVIHDEAHLEPAFQRLLVEIETEQRQGRFPDLLPLRVVELTATSRGEPNGNGRKDADEQSFGLTYADRKHKIVNRRILAKKGIRFCPIDDEKNLAAAIAERAQDLAKHYPNTAILVYARRVEDVLKIVGILNKAKCQVEQLTGTLRGLERDGLVRRPIFQRFLPPSNRDSDVTATEGTVYLVCTSAGEVGVDISAGHMVCDLTPFDSMVQRLGRVNRFGDGHAMIEVVHPTAFDTEKQPDGYESRREKTLALLKRLATREDARHDASPQALVNLPKDQRVAAFSPCPQVLETSDILFDSWALTTIRDRLPGRPPVERYLHGISGWEPPETHVAWREEVEVVTDDVLASYEPMELLADYPVKPHELLRDLTDRVFRHLQSLAADHPKKPAWIIRDDNSVRVTTLNEITRKDGKDELSGATVLLPPSAGGLENGVLNGSAPSATDVADEWYVDKDRTTKRRMRVWDDQFVDEGMQLVETIDIQPDNDKEEEEEPGGREDESPRKRLWKWFVRPRSADDDPSETAEDEQELHPHLQKVEELALAMARKLGLKKTEADAVVLAAKWHDLGKACQRWQRYVCNSGYPGRTLAKSRETRHWRFLDGYRHEFGSLLDLQFGRDGVPPDEEFARQSNDVKDLVLHFIAAHHGHARPHFPAENAFDPESATAHWVEANREVPRRFARLQRTYGRWGLAYLESLLRAADWAASAAASDLGEADDAEKKKEGRR